MAPLLASEEELEMLDRSRPYNETYGLPGVRYEQDGKEFTASGNLVVKVLPKKQKPDPWSNKQSYQWKGRVPSPYKTEGVVLTCKCGFVAMNRIGLTRHKKNAGHR